MGVSSIEPVSESRKRPQRLKRRLRVVVAANHRRATKGVRSTACESVRFAVPRTPPNARRSPLAGSYKVLGSAGRWFCQPLVLSHRIDFSSAKTKPIDAGVVNARADEQRLSDRSAGTFSKGMHRDHDGSLEVTGSFVGCAWIAGFAGTRTGRAVESSGRATTGVNTPSDRIRSRGAGIIRRHCPKK
jgi:hypothetical protein